MDDLDDSDEHQPFIL